MSRKKNATHVLTDYVVSKVEPVTVMVRQGKIYHRDPPEAQFAMQNCAQGCGIGSMRQLRVRGCQGHPLHNQHFSR